MTDPNEDPYTDPYQELDESWEDAPEADIELPEEP